MENTSPVEYRRADSLHEDYKYLTGLLDDELWKNYPATQDVFRQYNVFSEPIKVVLAYVDGQPAGCGALKPLAADHGEVKRVYVRPEYRKYGIGRGVMAELEKWAKETGYTYLILETGTLQTEAEAMYHRIGYTLIPNYGPYVGNKESICFRKEL